MLSESKKIVCLFVCQTPASGISVRELGLNLEIIVELHTRSSFLLCVCLASVKYRKMRREELLDALPKLCDAIVQPDVQRRIVAESEGDFAKMLQIIDEAEMDLFRRLGFEPQAALTQLKNCGRDYVQDQAVMEALMALADREEKLLTAMQMMFAQRKHAASLAAGAAPPQMSMGMGMPSAGAPPAMKMGAPQMSMGTPAAGGAAHGHAHDHDHSTCGHDHSDGSSHGHSHGPQSGKTPPAGFMEAFQELPPDMQQIMASVQQVMVTQGPAGLTPEMKQQMVAVQMRIITTMKSKGYDTSMIPAPQAQ